jgi:hypothetical protein
MLVEPTHLVLLLTLNEGVDEQTAWQVVPAPPYLTKAAKERNIN